MHVRVAERLAYRHEVDPGREQVCCPGVVVESYLPMPGPAQRGVQPRAQEVRAIHLPALGIREAEVMLTFRSRQRLSADTSSGSSTVRRDAFVLGS